MTELYYVEDDKIIGQMVREYLEQRHYKVTVCETAGEARRALERQVPALVLLDWNMPDGQGDRLCRFIRSNWRDLPVIFLTVRDLSRDMVAGFEAGADDYVTKPFDLEVLHARIRALLRRTKDASGKYLTCGGICIDQEQHTVTADGRDVELSGAEYELLLCLMRHKGKVVTREQILAQVWDVHGNYVNDNTLTVTMKRLREKLQNPHCIKTVRSVGYRMGDMP